MRQTGKTGTHNFSEAKLSSTSRSLPLLALWPFVHTVYRATFSAQSFFFWDESSRRRLNFLHSCNTHLLVLFHFFNVTVISDQASFFALSSVEFGKAYMASNSTRILRGEIGYQQSGHWFLDSPQSLPNDLTFSHNRPIQHWISNLSVIGVTHLEFLASIIFPFSRYGRLGIVVSCLAPRFTFINYCYRLAMRWPAVVKG